MAYSSIPDEWREVGEPVKKDLIDQIHDNLEDLNGRVANVEATSTNLIVINSSVKKQRDHAPIGTMVWSPLSESQFQTATDDGEWELCDGASVSGSDYATLMSRTAVPDVRGRFLRMKAHGTGTTVNPDGDVSTDTSQAQGVLAHTHTINHGHSHTIAAAGTFASSTHTHNIAHVHQWLYKSATSGAGTDIYGRFTADDSISTFTSSGSGNIFDSVTMGSGISVSALEAFPAGSATSWYTGGVISPPSGSAGSGASSGTPSATASVSNSGSVTNFSGNSGSTGTETRPVNVTENLFIKINKNYVTVRDGYFLWRAPQAITINQVILTPVTQGTSGTLTIDIKKGPHGTVTTSIFNSVPTLAYNATTPQTGTLNATNAQIDAGHYLRVDITTTQAKLQEFHILIAAIPS